MKIKMDETRKKNLKKNPKQRKTNKKNDHDSNFFSIIFLSK
jgi:hypothetical protein